MCGTGFVRAGGLRRFGLAWPGVIIVLSDGWGPETVTADIGVVVTCCGQSRQRESR